MQAVGDELGHQVEPLIRVGERQTGMITWVKLVDGDRIRHENPFSGAGWQAAITRPKPRLIKLSCTITPRIGDAGAALTALHAPARRKDRVR
ncbi:hypothetical protein CS0771_44290 [Catellatospora sp. IY07-71]|nr:hypothetical protein CS0771_44290 [Catellatospora sp. IY07-71]